MVEPKYPGAVERYVNMGDCYNKEALWPLRQKIADCMSGYKGCYQRAYRCLNAAADIMEDQRAVLLTDTLAQKLRTGNAMGFAAAFLMWPEVRDIAGKLFSQSGR